MKRKPSATGHCFEIPQTFDMGDVAFRAGQVCLEVGLALRSWADCFDPEGRDLLVSEPVHRIDMQAGEVVQVGGRAEQAGIDSHVDENRVACADGSSPERARAACISSTVISCRNGTSVRVQADRPGKEILQRDLIDGGGLRIAALKWQGASTWVPA